MTLTAPLGSSLTYLEPVYPDPAEVDQLKTKGSQMKRHRLFVKSDRGFIDASVISRTKGGGEGGNDDETSIMKFDPSISEAEFVVGDILEDFAQTLRATDAKRRRGCLAEGFDASILTLSPTEVSNANAMNKVDVTENVLVAKHTAKEASGNIDTDNVHSDAMKDDADAVDRSKDGKDTSGNEDGADYDFTGDDADADVEAERRYAAAFFCPPTMSSSCIKLAPPPGCNDFLFHLESDEGLCDLYDINI